MNNTKKAKLIGCLAAVAVFAVAGVTTLSARDHHRDHHDGGNTAVQIIRAIVDLLDGPDIIVAPTPRVIPVPAPAPAPVVVYRDAPVRHYSAPPAPPRRDYAKPAPQRRPQAKPAPQRRPQAKPAPQRKPAPKKGGRR